MNQPAIPHELLDALLAKLTERGEQRPFDTLFENDFLPLWQQTAVSGIAAQLRPRERLHGRQRKLNRKLRKKGWVTADIGGIEPCLHTIVRRHDVEQWVDNNTLLRVDVPADGGNTESYLVRVTGAQRDDGDGRLIHVGLVTADRADGSEVKTLSAQVLPVLEDESRRLKTALRTALAQDARFANFGGLWFVASACPPLTQAHIDSITAHLTAHPDGTAGDELLTLIPDYAAGATDAVRRFALNYRLLSVDAVHCISRAPSGKWMLKSIFDEWLRYPLKVRTPIGRSPTQQELEQFNRLEEVAIESITDPTLRNEAELERQRQSLAEQNRRRQGITLTLSFGEWAQGSIHLTDVEAAFFCFDADEELTFEDLTTGETFTAQFHRRRMNAQEDNLLFSEALNDWIHRNCLIPAAYIKVHRTENPLRFGIEWIRGEQTITYRRREWNETERRIERFTETFTSHCAFDPNYFIEQERLDDILTLQMEADIEGRYWLVVAKVFQRFDPHDNGLTFYEVFKYTDAVRAATRNTIRSILSNCTRARFQRDDAGKYHFHGIAEPPTTQTRPQAQLPQPSVEVAPPTPPPQPTVQVSLTQPPVAPILPPGTTRSLQFVYIPKNAREDWQIFECVRLCDQPRTPHYIAAQTGEHVEAVRDMLDFAAYLGLLSKTGIRPDEGHLTQFHQTDLGGRLVEGVFNRDPQIIPLLQERLTCYGFPNEYVDVNHYPQYLECQVRPWLTLLRLLTKW
jgi:hypothetical protein